MVTTFGLLLFSCSKSRTDIVTTPKNVYKIKSWSSNGTPRNYTYDNQGRLSLVDFSNGAYSEYVYESGKVVYKYFSSPNVLSSQREYILDANGMVVNERSSLNPLLDITYQYDNKQNIATYKYVNGANSFSYSYFFSKQNLDSICNYDKNNQWVSTTRFTYYTDKLNTIADENIGLFFTPKMRKNLLKTQETQYANGNAPTLYDFNYEFDDKDRAIKVKTSKAGVVQWTEIITYE